jgi:hypothetical protein
MFKKPSIGGRRKSYTAAAGLLAFATLAFAQAAGPDSALAGWIGREITIETSTIDDHIPVGGKLTFIYDSDDNIVRVCTRNSSTQRYPWQMDLAQPCGVTLTFTRGERYCSLEDVKAGNAEVLSACHRLRSRDVAMRPARGKTPVELNDMIVFLIQGDAGKHVISILVDSPSRVTSGGGGATGKD